MVRRSVRELATKKKRKQNRAIHVNLVTSLSLVSPEC